MISKVVALGREEVNFDLGNPEPAEAWVAAERRLGRPIARSWRRFVGEFGAGRIWVRSGAHPQRDDRAPPARNAFQVGDACGNQTEFDITVHDALLTGPFRYGFRLGGDEEKNWCWVGSDFSGDCLLLRAETAWGDAPVDAELAWYNHELAELTYRWPGLAEFLGQMVEWHQGGRPELMGERRRSADRLERIVPDVPVLSAMANAAGWVRCPHCGWRFLIDDGREWEGGVHHRCGQRLDVSPHRPG